MSKRGNEILYLELRKRSLSNGVCPMIEIPNCGNCSYHEIQNGEDHHCKKHPRGNYARWIPHDEYETISVIGCLSHPDARAYLMRGVIEELVGIASVYRNEIDDCANGIEKAIDIITNEVEKK